MCREHNENHPALFEKGEEGRENVNIMERVNLFNVHLHACMELSQ
jgi:hypothetical protein